MDRKGHGCCWQCGAGYKSLCARKVMDSKTELANDQQQAPVPNANPAVWGLVIQDMKGRDQFGRDKYKTPLQPFNGRDALTDAYQEALDLCVYLRQSIFERDGK